MAYCGPSATIGPSALDPFTTLAPSRSRNELFHGNTDTKSFQSMYSVNTSDFAVGENRIAQFIGPIYSIDSRP